ncbi:MAG: mevalonate kinase [Candidatus Bathyarchaeota archaeon]|nr:MAG: mevalonate kinase [Candidatus Bathyarchaeota archaeon]
MSVEATAPGKAILFGEHSVVYRGPAIVLAIDKRAKIIAEKRSDKRIHFDCLDMGFEGYFEGDVYVPIRGEAWRGRRLQGMRVAAWKTLEHLGQETGLSLTARSDIPVAAGLGSSAAICVATVAAVGELLGGNLSKKETCDLAYEGEKVVHGTPSGVDNNISTYGGVLRYERGESIERLELGEGLPFVIGNSRRKRSTRRLVARVKALREREPKLVDGLIDAMVGVAESGLEALKERDLRRLGDLMNINHGLLASLGVSIARLDLMVHASRGAGAYGAKLTGAGGGGCMIALLNPSKVEDIRKAIWRTRGEPHVVNISNQGVETRRIK